MKKLFTSVVLLAVVGVGVWFWLGKQKDDVGPKGSAGLSSALVESRDIHFSINAAGEIGPADQVSVRPEVNGRILELPVDIGDSVRKGQVLFALDDRDLQIENESQQKSIDRAKLQLEQAERNYLRSRSLFEERLISKELFEDTATAHELAKNALAQSEKSLELVQDRLRKTRILAPFDCTVLIRPVSVGQAVSGSGGFNSGTEVLTIANLNDMVISAHINQADVARLKVAQEVAVQVEAVPGLKTSGKVERIAPQATIKNNIKGFAVRILLTNVDPRVRPGMTANIQIPVAAADNVVAVPLAAVFTERDPGSQRAQRFVYVIKNGEFERREVQIGVSDYFYAEVQKGLASGETVALEQPPKEKTPTAKQGPPAKRGGGQANQSRQLPSVVQPIA